MQETRKKNADEYVTELGFKVMLSGGSNAAKEWAGVGFIVSPRFTSRVVSYCPFSNRLASLTFLHSINKHAVICAYAPHNQRPVDEKLHFYHELTHVFRRVSVNGCKLIAGDLNARLGLVQAGEDAVLGEFGFGRVARHVTPVPNRQLLMEFCFGEDLCVANTFFNHTPDRLVTFREVGTPPFADVSPDRFAILDLFVLPRSCSCCVHDITSDRSISLASQHFPVTAVFTFTFDADPIQRTRSQTRRNWCALSDPTVRQQFVSSVSAELVERSSTEDLQVLEDVSNIPTVNERWKLLKDAAIRCAEAHVPTVHKQPRKPWISAATLALIQSRTLAHISGDWLLEKSLRKQVHRSAKRDRARWLEALVAGGDWTSIKRFRRGGRIRQGRLNDACGAPVSTDERASTFAHHLQTAQWHVRETRPLPHITPLNNVLHLNEGPFKETELRRAISQLKSGRAFKDDDLPVEFYKALSVEPGHSLTWLLDLFNSCWSSRVVPSEWTLASVRLIYKKGNPATCDNYRPLCIQAVACKLFASLLKNRLMDGGCLQHLWSSQFGFRPGCSTEDAIFAARRRIELACAQRDGRIILLALDWRKAFDSINVEALLNSLLRFGISDSYVQMIESILKSRNFVVDEFGFRSAPLSQDSGISQGCTLSPLLFIIAMTVMMADAVTLLSPRARDAYERGDLCDLVYADDTLLLGTNSAFVNEYVRAVARAGETLGMTLHWDKFQLLSVKSQPTISTPAGVRIDSADKLCYLGATLSDDGLVDSEITRKIGVARSDFRHLSRIWRHSSLPRGRKIQFYASLIESKLLYSLASTCMTSSQIRRLNAFQNQCLRSILRIPGSFISRVPNISVLQKAGLPSAADVLARRKLVLFGKVLRSSDYGPLRTPCFIPRTTRLATERFVRRVGRPRKEWTREVADIALHNLGSWEAIDECVSDEKAWKLMTKTARVW